MALDHNHALCSSNFKIDICLGRDLCERWTECLTWIDVAQSITALELITSRSWAVEGFSRPLDDTVQGCLAIWSKFNLFSGSMTRRPLSRSSQSFERKKGTRYWHLITRSRSSSRVGASNGNVPLTNTYNTTPSDLKKKKILGMWQDEAQTRSTTQNGL